MKNKLVGIFFLFMLVLSSCKSPKLAAHDEAYMEVDSCLSLPIETMMVSKFSATWVSGKTLKTFKGSLRVQKDSVIYITISPAMGIELLRVKITPDSLMILDRYNKQYFLGTLASVEEGMGIGIDFNTLQKLLMNQTFDKQSENKISFFVNKMGQLAKTSIQNRLKSQNLNFSYSHFQLTELGMYPFEYTMDLRNGKKLSRLSIGFEKIKFNELLLTPFRIPSSYSPMKTYSIYSVNSLQ